MLAVIIKVLGTIGAIVIAGALIGVDRPSHKRALMILPVVLGVILLLWSVVVIDAGEAAAKKRFGKVVEGHLDPGLHLVVPLVDQVVVYRTKQLVYETSDHPDTSEADYPDYSIDTMTSDGQVIDVRYTIKITIDPKMVGYIAQNVGTERDVIEKVVKAYSRSEARNIPKGFRADQLYGTDIYKCQEAIATKLRPGFERNGIVLDEFLLREIDFSVDFQQALEQKQIAVELITKKESEISQATMEASATIALAEGYREATIARANGDAEAIELIQAQLAKSPGYAEYVLAKGIADGSSGIQWSILPDSAVPFLNLQAKPTGE